MFIVFEGIDGSGKTTLSKMLAKELSGYWTCEPTDGEIGRLIRSYLSSGNIDNISLSLLFAADRVEHCKEIEKVLNSGRDVICDRYLYSSIAYQSSLGVEENFLWEINKYAIKPDLVFLLVVDVDEAMKRVKGKDIFENKNFLEKVQEKYLELAKRFNFIVIDTTNISIEEAYNKVRVKVYECKC
ncbi:thymidylate kinase [Methanocaldococcus infernus ME]|uniref:Probable thymidylate kinase n=1 Tax=Methanocaldococcus infernus (strain DSM 11812 / JCM 15783 / ME) TaxID=573063 RepID=D5VSH2_METIM|nr:dTMP kinase [Methanocaldococcus infernus]ADG13525.1 thymidylate kinase [Methanocaldococcus infernus ME]